MKRNLKIRFFAVLAAAVMVLVNISPRVIADDEDPTVSIPIAMATDNNYVVPTLVSIVSASENANPETTLRFYIMVTSDFSEKNKSKVQKLNENLANCEITLGRVHIKRASKIKAKVTIEKYITSSLS